MITIPVHAHAEIVIDDLIEMYIQWFIDTGSEMLDMTPEELIAYTFRLNRQLLFQR